MPSEPPAPHDAALVSADAAIAFFCSKSCPGDIILKAQDWANARGAESAPVIGGFHTPVERDVLRILLRAGAPIIIVLARAAKGWRAPNSLGPVIKAAIAAGAAQIVSPFPATQNRTTAATAEARNRHILDNCSTIMIAHASLGGKTEKLAIEAVSRGLDVLTLQGASNSNLLDIGAKVAPQ